MNEFYLYILLFFIAASLLLYVILGGADYGAGILELLPIGDLRQKQKETINSAMGPVWEANHMWLIIVVVILFVGFPKVFTTIMTLLHIPMCALLFGIVLRGAAFTFRHYDAIQEPRSQRFYTLLFGVSSLWSSLWIGIIAASLFRGRLDINSTDFYSVYVSPWAGLFPFSMGIFVCCIFAYLASIYLIGETSNRELKNKFLQRGKILNALLVLSGGLVFLCSYLDAGNLHVRFFESPAAVLCMLFATGLLLFLWRFAESGNSLLLRAIAASQTASIIFGWYFIYSPDALILKSGPMTFADAVAPTATLQMLSVSLVVGSFLIFPSLYFLLKVFKQPI